MYTVYILFSENFNKIYIGYTSNIEQRFLSHNQLSKKGYTVKYRPWRIVYTESFEDKKQAIKREKELKSAKGRNWIHKTIIKKCSLGLYPPVGGRQFERDRLLAVLVPVTKKPFNI
jgi:putative endonuclease